MKKTTLKIIIGLIILFITVLWTTYLLPTLKVATGYTAKYVCSSTFLSNISEQNIDNALDIFLVRNVAYSIDSTNREVKASIFGLAERTATYYKNSYSCGCTLGSTEFQIEEKESLITNDQKKRAEILWPQGDKKHDSIPSNINIQKIDSILRNTLDENPDIFVSTVAYKNFLVGERYNDGVDENTRLLGWSMTKTIGNALLGILEKNNKIDVQNTSEIEEWQNDERKDITINNLLQMNSGLKWTENYSRLSDVTTMLYLEENFPEYAISSIASEKPNQKWLYSSGTTNILSRIMRSKFDHYNQYLAFPYDSLFHQIDMRSAVIELDNNGNHILSSYAWATARDWTRFGLLYLYKGQWFGKRIFSEKWASYSVTPAPNSNKTYGAQLWLNKRREELPSVPEDAFYENGFGGQRILIIPSKEVVITVMSGNQDHFDFDSFYKEILSCF